MNAAYIVPLVGITLMTIGIIGVGMAAWHSHRQNQRLDFIRSLGSEAELYAEAAPTLERVQTPLVNRMFGPAAKGLRHNLSRLYPSQDIDRVHADLLKAGSPAPCGQRSTSPFRWGRSCSGSASVSSR